MSYKSDCLAQSSLVAFWGLDDTVGAGSAADASGNGLSLTPSGSPTFGAAGFVDGLATSVSCSSAAFLYRDPPSGSALDLTSAMTMCGWFCFDNGTPASGSVVPLLGRAGGATLGCQNGAHGIISGMPATVTNYAQGNSNNSADFPTGTIAFIAIIWSQASGVAKYVLNGTLYSPWLRDQALPSLNGGAGRWYVFNNTSNRPTMRASGIAIFNKELPIGVLRQFAADNTQLTMPTYGSQNEPNAGATGMRGAGLDGGHLSLDGSKVVAASSGLAYRPDQFANDGVYYPAVTLTTGNWQAQLPQMIAKSIHEFVITNTQRPSAIGNIADSYMDSSGVLHNHCFTDTPNHTNLQTNWTVMEMMSGCATLHRWSHAPADDSLIRILTGMINQVIATADPTTGNIAPTASVSDFVMLELGWTLVMIRNHIPAATMATWIAALAKHSEYFRTTSGIIWYINGNRELNACAGMYALWLLTGDSTWLTKYNAQWLKTRMPPTDGSIGSANGNAGTAGFGLKDGTNTLIPDPTVLNPASSLAFFAESPNSSVAPGLDWDYLQNDLQIMYRLWALSGDPTHWKIIQAMTNQFLVRLNTTTWIYDYTGGTRHTGTSTTKSHFLEAAMISGKRPDLTVDCSTHWPIARNLITGDMHGLGGINSYRDLAGVFGSPIYVSARWPGVPTFSYGGA